MQVQLNIRRNGAWSAGDLEPRVEPQLVLVFSSPHRLAEEETWRQLRGFYPAARLIGCSTAGEIANTEVYDDAIVCTALAFSHSSFVIAKARVDPFRDSEAIGISLGSQLPPDGLVHVFVLSDGSKTNGTALLKGLLSGLPGPVAVTGGLAGDGTRFASTAICVDSATPTDQVVAVGFYGERLRVGYGSQGGWDAFGVERTVTRSEGNVLYELDGSPALQLYKKYLGPQAAHLPASALRFPLSIRPDVNDENSAVVRTILAVDDIAQTMTFAGDIPVGYRARLMSANTERLLDGATGAALIARQDTKNEPHLALLVSCVGRKLVLNQRIEEEVEAVRNVMGRSTVISGFYSYGELSPFGGGGKSTFHNQTMTVTTLSEY